MEGFSADMYERVGIDILYHGHSFLTTISQVEVS